MKSNCMRDRIAVPMLALLAAFVVMQVRPAAATDDGRQDGGAGALLGSALEELNLKAPVPPPPDFVQATHRDPSTLKFIPVGTPHPKRVLPVKSSDEVEALKASLDAAKAAQLAPKPVPAPAMKPGRKAKPVKRAETTPDN